MKPKKVTKEEFLEYIEKNLLQDSWDKTWKILYANKDIHPFIRKAVLDQLLHSDVSPLEHAVKTLDLYTEVATLHLNVDYFICKEEKRVFYMPKKTNGTGAERMYA